MKLIKVKKQDAKPSVRIKAAGNVFVEVYKDNKGYYYRIDVPGATDFVSKERFENQDKAKLAGTTHAKKLISKVKGDQKKVDASEYEKFDKIVRQIVPKVQREIDNGIKQLEKLDYDKIEEEGEDPDEIEEMMQNWQQAKELMEGIY